MLASNIPLKSTAIVHSDEYDTVKTTLQFHRALQCFGYSINDLDVLYTHDPDAIDNAIDLILGHRSENIYIVEQR